MGARMPFTYGRIRTMMEMVAKAFDKAGSTDAKAVAYALEGMEHQTSYGIVTMRAEDHQLIQPLYISTMTKVGHQGRQVRCGEYRVRLEDRRHVSRRPPRPCRPPVK